MDLSVQEPESVTATRSRVHHAPAPSSRVPAEERIRRCLAKLSPDEPEKGIAAAKVMQCTLREMVALDRVRGSLAEYYGLKYLLTSLDGAIDVYEKYGRVNELMFVSMRIGRELCSYEKEKWFPPRKKGA